LPSGHTPTLTISGGTGTVILEDIETAHPFTGVRVAREYSERRTRDSVSGAAKSIRVFRRYNGSEEEMRVQVPHCSQTQYTRLRSLIAADPPTVNVTYLHLSSVPFDMVDLDPVPDSFDWMNIKEHAVGFTLKRDGSV